MFKKIFIKCFYITILHFKTHFRKDEDEFLRKKSQKKVSMMALNEAQKIIGLEKIKNEVTVHGQYKNQSVETDNVK